MNKKTKTEKKLKLKKEKVSNLVPDADLKRAVGGARTIGSCSASGGPVSSPACGCPELT
jgi:hypothetical protein